MVDPRVYNRVNIPPNSLEEVGEVEVTQMVDPRVYNRVNVPPNCLEGGG